MTLNTDSQKGDLDAHHYKQHSEIQYKLAQTPLQEYPFIGNESILDIGCGDGTITAYIAQYAPQGQVIGIDKSPAMIALAQESFACQKHPHLNFHLQDACSFQFEQSFDLITSFSCLHWIKDQQRALQNIKNHLKPKAKAIFVTFPRCKTFWDPIEAIVYQEKWKRYFEHDLQPHSLVDAPHYEALLKAVDLKILSIETTSHMAKFVGKKGFEDYVRGWLPFLLDLPKHLHHEFLEEIGAQSLELAPVESDGFVYHPYEKIVIYVERN